MSYLLKGTKLEFKTENGRHFQFPGKKIHIVINGRRTNMDSFGQRKTWVTCVIYNFNKIEWFLSNALYYPWCRSSTFDNNATNEVQCTKWDSQNRTLISMWNFSHVPSSRPSFRWNHTLSWRGGTRCSPASTSVMQILSTLWSIQAGRTQTSSLVAELEFPAGERQLCWGVNPLFCQQKISAWKLRKFRSVLFVHSRNLLYKDIIKAHLGQRLKQRDNEYQQVCGEHFSKTLTHRSRKCLRVLL